MQRHNSCQSVQQWAWSRSVWMCCCSAGFRVPAYLASRPLTLCRCQAWCCSAILIRLPMWELNMKRSQYVLSPGCSSDEREAKALSSSMVLGRASAHAVKYSWAASRVDLKGNKATRQTLDGPENRGSGLGIPKDLPHYTSTHTAVFQSLGGCNWTITICHAVSDARGINGSLSCLRCLWPLARWVAFARNRQVDSLLDM